MDAQTINAIAATAVGFLSPYLAKAGEVVARKLGEDLYNILKARFGARPAAQEALADLEAAPTDSDRQASVRSQLRKLLDEDEAFALELQNLLGDAARTEDKAVEITQTAGNDATQFGQVYGPVTIG
jgi:hypothetical protein